MAGFLWDYLLLLLYLGPGLLVSVLGLPHCPFKENVHHAAYNHLPSITSSIQRSPPFDIRVRPGLFALTRVSLCFIIPNCAGRSFNFFVDILGSAAIGGGGHNLKVYYSNLLFIKGDDRNHLVDHD